MAGLHFACIVPHPPLLVPDIGRGQERAIINTINAMETLADKLAGQQVDTVLIISPHGQSNADAMGILTAPSSTGDLRGWGDHTPQRTFNNDLNMVAQIQNESKESGVPVRSIGQQHYELDHGVMVPLHFLSRSREGIPLVPLTFSWLSLDTHFAFGKAIRRAVERSGKSAALIASGDLSHRLIPGAPAGYDPKGKIFDEKLVGALATLDTDSILKLDQKLTADAGECGLRSFVIMLGALDGLSVTPTILSYEGPFGVGYLVASFEIKR